MRQAYECIILVLVMLVGFVIVAWLGSMSKNAVEYNKNACAAVGYQEDCQTPLK